MPFKKFIDTISDSLGRGKLVVIKIHYMQARQHHLCNYFDDEISGSGGYFVVISPLENYSLFYVSIHIDTSF